jgi:LysR family glycine cleavage system transcriptional activator
MQAGRDKSNQSSGSFRSPPPLHCLQAFEAVARNLSLAKAAGELRLSGSALGQSIAALEDRLGLKLVRCLSPNVELTKAGEQYFHAVQAFAHRLRDGLYERFPVGRAQLRVTASQALLRLWLAPRLVLFTQRHPRIDLIITSTEKFHSLKGGGVDIGLRYGGTVDEAMVVVPLWTDRLVAAGSPALARRADGLSPAALSRALPLVDHPVASWRQWLGAIDPSLAAVNPLLTCNDLHLAIEAACQGLGLVIAPSRVLSGKISSGQLRRVTTHSAPGKAYQAVLWREQADRPPLRAFVQWLREQVGADCGTARDPDS